MEIAKKTKNAGAVIINPDGLIVVVSQQGVSWSLPKGHVEEGETLKEAAMREVYEETGIKNLTFIKELGTYQRFRVSQYLGLNDGKKELKEITLFVFTTPETILRPMDKGNPEARWVARENVADLLTHPKDKEFFISILNQLP